MEKELIKFPYFCNINNFDDPNLTALGLKQGEAIGLFLRNYF